MELATASVPTTLLPGQILLENLYLSVDPYMRGRMNTKTKSYSTAFELGKPLNGGGVSRILKSENDLYKTGDIVLAHIGWEQYTLIPKGINPQKIENKHNLPLSYFLGILGMPGATAYHGLLNIGMPVEGNTVFVSGAAGAVGLVVGQIAKIKGCRVVGSAGTDEKVAALVNEFGFDYAFNYKTVGDQKAKLQELCPNGIDVYFDNVGGETLDTVLTLMNVHGRLVECGMVIISFI
jgi:NADPH-dependent curcumin reductase CurA